MNTENAEQFLKEYGIKDRYIFDSKDNELLLKCVLEEYYQSKLKTPNKINLDTRIRDMDFSVRAYNCLKAAEIRTLRDLLGFSIEELMGYRNFGRRSLLEIEQFVSENGLSFKPIVLETRPSWKRNKILFEDFNNGVSRKELVIKYLLSYHTICNIIKKCQGEQRRINYGRE
tara:strand:- start:32 stop:547 length:516 start_codon:yes stop_codon:yes gene_type:complete